MDRLAEVLGMDPLELRRKNALESGDPMPTTGQVIETPLPTVEVIDSLAAMPIPEESERAGLPGGSGLTTEEHHVIRGIGYAMGIKNLGFSEGFDDFSQARVLLTPEGAVVSVEELISVTDVTAEDLWTPPSEYSLQPFNLLSEPIR